MTQGLQRHPAGAPASIGGRFASAGSPAPAVTLAEGLPCARCAGRFGEPADSARELCVTCEAERSTIFATERAVYRENASSTWGVAAPVVGATVRGHDWGKVNDVYPIADGIAIASCEGHGGVMLSPERNRRVPVELRRSDGWYEEDCDYMIAVRTFPEAFASSDIGPWRRLGVEESFAHADAQVRQYEPDAWETLTGREVQPGESRSRDKQRFEADFRAKHGDFATVSRHAADVDEEGGDLRFAAGAGKIAVVPRAEYNRLRRLSLGKAYGVPIPQQDLQDVPIPPRVATRPRSDEPVTFDWDSMTDRNALLSTP